MSIPRRILTETRRLQADPGNNLYSLYTGTIYDLEPGVSCIVDRENKRYFTILIEGPKDTPYEGLIHVMYLMCLMFYRRCI